MMITAINCSMLYYPYTSYDDGVNTGSSKSTRFEPKIKHLMKETLLDHRSARNFLMSMHNIRLKMSIMRKNLLKSTSICSRCNNIING